MATRIRRPFTRRFSKQADEPTSAADSASPAAAASSAPAGLQEASDSIRARSADDQLAIGSRSDAGGSPAEPPAPGQQSGDSGIKTGSSPAESGLTQRAAPGGDSPAAELDASTEAALSQLADARASFKGPLDVFEAAAGAGQAASPGPDSSRRDVGGSRPDDLFGSGADGGQEHAAEVAGQLASGGRSLFGDRLAGVNEEIAIGAGLIGDQQARATSPSVAADGGALADAIGSVSAEDIRAQASKAGVGVDDFSPSATGGGAGEAEGESDADGEGEPEERGPLDALFEFFSGEREFSGSIDLKTASPSRDFSEVDGFGKVENTTQAAVAEEVGVSNLETAVAKSLGTKGGGVKDPGDPDFVGGPPSEAQVAFRESLRRQLGVRPNTGGDIDPSEDATPVGGSGPLTDLPNDGESLIGQPIDNEPAFGGGHSGPLPGGTDIDPLEGSAFTGPALGGNPEDLDFGGGTLGLGLAPERSTAEDEEEEEDEDDDDA